MEKQRQSGRRGPDGHRRTGIRGLHQSGYGVVRSRAGKACGRGLGRRTGVNGCFAWTDQTRLGIGHCRCRGPACKAAEYQLGPSNATRCVDGYQSIADTFVQLFRPDGSGLIASRDGIRTNRGFAKEPSMNELEKFCPPPRLTATPRQVEPSTQLFRESANAASADLFQYMTSQLL